MIRSFTITNNYISTNNFQDDIATQLNKVQRFDSDLQESEKNKIFDYHVIVKESTIDGVAIHQISDIIQAIYKPVTLIFNHCKILNLDFAMAFIDINIIFRNCYINRIGIHSSTFSSLKFNNCIIQQFSICNSVFNEQGLSMLNCFSQNTEILYSKFKYVDITSSLLLNSTTRQNIISEIHLELTTIERILSSKNQIEWRGSSIRKCNFEETTINCDYRIICINTADRNVKFYYLPELDIIKDGSLTYSFNQLKEYVEFKKDDTDQKEYQNLKLGMDYIDTIRNKHYKNFIKE